MRLCWRVEQKDDNDIATRRTQAVIELHKIFFGNFVCFFNDDAVIVCQRLELRCLVGARLLKALGVDAVLTVLECHQTVVDINGITYAILLDTIFYFEVN